MKPILTAALFLIATFSLKSQTLNFGRASVKIDDGVKHVYAGQFISSFTSYTTYYITDRPIISGIAGFVAASLVGGLKEIYDKHAPGHVSSFKDFGNTVWGGAIQMPIYSAVVGFTDRKHKWNHINKVELDAQYSDIAIINP